MGNVNSEKYWDKRFKDDWAANQGDEQSKFFMNIALSNMPKWLDKYLKRNSNLTICDWGCAEGDGTSMIATKYKNTSVIGIDFSDIAIRKSNNKPNLPHNLEYQCVNLLTEQYDRKFDVIITSNVLEHFNDPWSVFEKITRNSKNVVFIMVPYLEDKNNLIDEHFHSFQPNDFIIYRNGWLLVDFIVIDTENVPKTYWAGKQAIAIYIKIDSILLSKIDVSQQNSGDTVFKLNKTVEHLNSEILKNNQEILRINSQLLENNKKIKDLEISNININNLLNSRRYRVVDDIFKIAKVKKYFRSNDKVSIANSEFAAIADKINKSKLFDKRYYLKEYKDVKESGIDPLEHYVLYGGKEGRNPSNKFISKYYALTNNTKESIPLIDFIDKKRPNKYSQKDFRNYYKLIDKKIVEESKKAKFVLLMQGMEWDSVMQQRPHHIAKTLAKHGVLVIYINENDTIPRKLNNNLFIVNPDWIKKAVNINSYLLFPAGYKKSYKALRKYINYGYKLIYEYIDELDEEICGDLTDQLIIYNRLSELRPKLVISSAKKLKLEIEKKVPNSLHLLAPNGVDINHFKIKNTGNSNTNELTNLNKPIVGYYGAIAPWLDYKLINEITSKRKDLIFVFIGVDYNNGLKRLNLNSNVVYLGPKKYDELPDYSKYFNCAIIPFKIGEIAKSTSPVKLFEYMAMGLPTVCTRDLYECRGYDYVYMSNNTNEFELNIDKAIKAKRDSKAVSTLIKQANNNTWESRAKAIIDELEHIKKGK